jgi:hypothetical protein
MLQLMGNTTNATGGSIGNHGGHKNYTTTTITNGINGKQIAVTIVGTAIIIIGGIAAYRVDKKYQGTGRIFAISLPLHKMC